MPELSKVECPILVLAGGLNPVHNAQSAKKTANAINPKLLTFKLYKNAGSPVYADCHDKVLNDIKAFLINLDYKL